MTSLRPDRRLTAELTNYGGDGPRELRVDLVDKETDATLASLTPDATLALVTEALNAVIEARHRGRPRVAPAPDPGD